MNLKVVTPFSWLPIALVAIIISTSIACDKEEDDPRPLQSMTFEYAVHNGQAVAAAPYAGVHPTDLSATMTLEELEGGKTKITISLRNTIEGAMYHMHAHDAADPANTPNGTPYIESPNADIFAKALAGTGGDASISQEANRSFDDLINGYNGFFVVHDPLQTISTVDIGTYLVLGGFAREQPTTNYTSSSFEYAFNTGQLVADFAYSGMHPESLAARIRVDELADNKSRVVVHIMNSLEGETYHTHAHDVADPATTPNGTPYIESPNASVFAAPIEGNGGTTARAVISDKSHTEITNSYEGFFVIHDPLQAISTVDPTTYIILGSFAR